MEKNYNYLLKYIIIGDASVGKSNLLMKFTQNKFTENYQATIGVEFGAKNLIINKKIYRIQIWDTAGQENFRSITRSYYKNSVCAMVVYDITSRKSFDNVMNWIEEIQNNSSKTILIVLVGNKIDLKDNRDVSFEEGKELANKNGIIFMETSAKTGEGVEEIFKKTVQEISNKIGDNYFNLDSENCGISKGDKEGNELDDNKNKSNKYEVKLGFEPENKKGKKGCC